MKAPLIRIGNSRGIRIPKPLIDLCRLGDEVELEVRNQELTIRPLRAPRQGWDAAFGDMASSGEDQPLDLVAERGPAWDAEEWEWPSDDSTSS